MDKERKFELITLPKDITILHSQLHRCPDTRIISIVYDIVQVHPLMILSPKGKMGVTFFREKDHTEGGLVKDQTLPLFFGTFP